MKFLDSNVWLYAFWESQDPRKHGIARNLIEQGSIAISQQIIGEVCKGLLRKRVVEEQEIPELIESFYTHYKIVLLTEEDFVRASALRQRYRFEHWDSLLVVAALKAEADTFYSEDMHDGLLVEGVLTIKNPFR